MRLEKHYIPWVELRSTQEFLRTCCSLIWGMQYTWWSVVWSCKGQTRVWIVTISRISLLSLNLINSSPDSVHKSLEAVDNSYFLSSTHLYYWSSQIAKWDNFLDLYRGKMDLIMTTSCWKPIIHLLSQSHEKGTGCS